MSTGKSTQGDTDSQGGGVLSKIAQDPAVAIPRLVAIGFLVTLAVFLLRCGESFVLALDDFTQDAAHFNANAWFWSYASTFTHFHESNVLSMLIGDFVINAGEAGIEIMILLCLYGYHTAVSQPDNEDSSSPAILEILEKNIPIEIPAGPAPLAPKPVADEKRAPEYKPRKQPDLKPEPATAAKAQPKPRIEVLPPPKQAPKPAPEPRQEVAVEQDAWVVQQKQQRRMEVPPQPKQYPEPVAQQWERVVPEEKPKEAQFPPKPWYEEWIPKLKPEPRREPEARKEELLVPEEKPKEVELPPIPRYEERKPQPAQEPRQVERVPQPPPRPPAEPQPKPEWMPMQEPGRKPERLEPQPVPEPQREPGAVRQPGEWLVPGEEKRKPAEKQAPLVQPPPPQPKPEPKPAADEKPLPLQESEYGPSKWLPVGKPEQAVGAQPEPKPEQPQPVPQPLPVPPPVPPEKQKDTPFEWLALPPAKEHELPKKPEYYVRKDPKSESKPGKAGDKPLTWQVKEVEAPEVVVPPPPGYDAEGKPKPAPEPGPGPAPMRKQSLPVPLFFRSRLLNMKGQWGIGKGKKKPEGPPGKPKPQVDIQARFGSKTGPVADKPLGDPKLRTPGPATSEKEHTQKGVQITGSFKPVRVPRPMTDRTPAEQPRPTGQRPLGVRGLAEQIEGRLQQQQQQHQQQYMTLPRPPPLFGPSQGTQRPVQPAPTSWPPPGYCLSPEQRTGLGRSAPLQGRPFIRQLGPPSWTLRPMQSSVWPAGAYNVRQQRQQGVHERMLYPAPPLLPPPLEPQQMYRDVAEGDEQETETSQSTQSED